MIGRIVKVTMDRPMGSVHPEHPTIRYPINYGYVEGTLAPDGEWQDAYVLGAAEPLESFTGEVIAVVVRRDDVETKWVVAPKGAGYSREAIAEAINFQERYFDSMIEMNRHY